MKKGQKFYHIMNPTENKYHVEHNKIVIFGAGKIGRSFIGQLFYKGGYKIIFVDIDPVIVDRLNKQKNYRIIFKNGKEEEIIVRNVEAILFSETINAAESVSTAGILAISVGKNAIEKVIPVIAKGLILRYKHNPDCPLDIIIAENMREAGHFIKNQLIQNLPSDYPFEKMVGLVETSIGKMVPIMNSDELGKDPLMIYAEPYNTLIVDAKGFKSPVPNIENLLPKNNIKAWVDRKAFIHNLGHSTAAYSGHYKFPNAVYMYEVLSDKEIFNFTREVMHQSADALKTVYKDDFTEEDLNEHIDDLLQRFCNKALKDTIYRVGNDLIRKLGYDDRFVGAIKLAKKAGKPYDKIIKAMSYGLCFDAKDANGNIFPSDLEFLKSLTENFDNAMTKYLKLDPVTDRYIIDGLKTNYDQLKIFKSRNSCKNQING